MVHFENEVPVQIEDRCVNAAVVPDYLLQDYTATTPHDYLSLIAPLTEGEHIVEAVQATSEVRAAAHPAARSLPAYSPPHGRRRILSHTLACCSPARATVCRAISARNSPASAKRDC